MENKRSVGIAVILLLALPLVCFGQDAKDNQNSIIKLGMPLEEAEKILENFGAVETNMDIMPVESSAGGYMEVVCYGLRGENPAIIINYEKENEKNIIQVLDLYYEYGHKADPRNKWKHVEEVDLTNIPPAPK